MPGLENFDSPSSPLNFLPNLPSAQAPFCTGTCHRNGGGSEPWSATVSEGSVAAGAVLPESLEYPNAIGHAPALRLGYATAALRGCFDFPFLHSTLSHEAAYISV